jgi:hypothetical protein
MKNKRKKTEWYSLDFILIIDETYFRKIDNICISY